MFGFRPEPIAIPVVQAPVVAPTAADMSSACPVMAPSSSLNDVEPLEQQLLLGGSSSEIQYSDLQVMHNIGHGSSGVVQKVLHVVCSATSRHLNPPIRDLHASKQAAIHAHAVGPSRVVLAWHCTPRRCAHCAFRCSHQIQPSDSVLALKTIPVEADEAKRKQILLELKALHEASHPSIVTFYGAFYREGVRSTPHASNPHHLAAMAPLRH